MRTPKSDPDWPSEVRNFWKQMHGTYEFEADTCAVLKTACDVYARMLRLKQIIRKHGEVVESPTGLLRSRILCTDSR